MRVQLIFNPASGRASPRRVDALAAAFRARGAEVTTTATGRAAPAILASADHVVVVGGDGTVRHVAHALGGMERAPRLSVYPGGTVNLLAREWAGRVEPRRFAARVLARGDRARHAVACGDASFLCCASVGWESVAVAGVDLRLKSAIGRLAYLVSAVRSLVRWRPAAITLVADGETVACEAFHIAKGTYYAGRYRLTGRSLGHAPVMEVVALRRARRCDLLRFWAALVAGYPVARLRNVVTIECRTLTAAAAGPIPVQADGDVVGALPMTFAVAARAIVTC